MNEPPDLTDDQTLVNGMNDYMNLGNISMSKKIRQARELGLPDYAGTNNRK